MRKLLTGVLLVLAAEGAALACSCVAPGSPEQSRALAREVVERAVAIVEADVLSEYRPGGPGELVRVHRVLWGTAPRELRIARGPFASGASCDLLLARGQRRILILYDAADAVTVSGPPGGRAGAGAGAWAIQNLCSDFLVSEPGHLAVTLEEARRRGAPAPADGERG